ncbi:MAG TPA: DUF3108 domain-containing protein [Steroidobacteraceae bacterium]|nr:DUF3108 domain-containing protein [Steroidobacteraceae bacterium]
MAELRMRAVAVMGLLAMAALPAAAAELRPFTASYNITYGGLSAGTATLTLKRESDGRWSYQSLTTARGFFRLAMPAELRSRSVFTVQDGKVVPELFVAEDGTSGSSRDQELHFDWAAGRVTGKSEKSTVNLPLQPGMLDSLSVQVALMHELLAGRTPARFVLVDKGKIKDYNYTAEGEDLLRTPLGEHRTVIFRSSRPGSSSGTWFWCAPEMNFLPLKVERREGKNVQWSLRLQSATVE